MAIMLEKPHYHEPSYRETILAMAIMLEKPHHHEPSFTENYDGYGNYAEETPVPGAFIHGKIFWLRQICWRNPTTTILHSRKTIMAVVIILKKPHYHESSFMENYSG